MAYPLLYIGKVKENKTAFEAKVRSIAMQLSIDPNWLMINMFSESGLNSSIENSIGCVGLIQFCHDSSGNTSKNINGEIVDLQQLKNLSNVDQLDYVYKYYAPYAGRIKTFEDLYMIDFFPIALGWDDDKVIESSTLSAANIAKSNPSFDINKDGQITVGEFKSVVRKKLPFGYKTEIGRTIMSIAAPISDNPLVVLVIIALFVALITLLIKSRNKK